MTLLDRQNHHLFQPLLYQVAMAALSPADIAAPIRSILSRSRNVRVLQTEVTGIDPAARRVSSSIGNFAYDYVLIAAGAQHTYFGHTEWEPCAPGLKTLAQATEIRGRVLAAFESAESSTDAQAQRRWLTFAIVGGGPTGVELAGAIGEMSRYTLARDFRRIDPRQTRIVLLEAGPRILPAFSEKMAARAQRDLETLGVQVRTDARVINVDANGVEVNAERLMAGTVVWAAGVQASALGACISGERDHAGRIAVQADLTVKGHPEIYVLGDMARCLGPADRLLPGLAAVAMQQGEFAGRRIRARSHAGEMAFSYRDLGQMATIGRSRAVVEIHGLRFAGRLAWWLWLLVHIYRLTGFRNRLSVLLHWAWSYFTFNRGARLIVDREWRSYGAGHD